MKAAVRPIVVIGLGNVLLGDEGIGVALAQTLAREYADSSEVDCIDLGTGGLPLLHVLEGRRKAVLLDCALMGEPPGAYRRFTPAEVRERSAPPCCAMHEGNLLQMLELAVELDCLPAGVVIIGIEPSSIAPSLTLSPILQHNFDNYLAVVREEVVRERKIV